MKKFSCNIILVFLSVFLLLNLVNAQEDRSQFPVFENVQKVAQSGYQFLKIDPSARSAGMGGASTTLEGDASTVFINPAGIATIKYISVFAGYTSWFAGMQQQTISAVMNLGDYGYVGLNAQNFDYGDIKGTKISNSDLGYEDTGNLDVTELAVGFTYGRRFTEKFGVGLTAKYCHQDLVARNSSVWAFDVGTIYSTGWHDLKIAVSIQHFGKSIRYIDEYFELPLTFRVGLAGDLLSMLNFEDQRHQLTLAVEGVNPRDFNERVHFGAEYWYNQMFAIRSGYKVNYDVEGLSIGLGIRYMGFEVDYSYSDFGNLLEAVNRFTLIANF